MIKVHNLPNYARNYTYTVVKVVDGELWFYGSYSDNIVALGLAIEIGGEFLYSNQLETC